MAKRFADTKLSRESWYRRLSPVHKCAWRFLLDECDVAGAWPVDLDSMEFHVGAPIDLEAFADAVNSDKKDRLVFLDGGKLFIPGFVEFQYGTLSEDCKPHKPVLERLKKLNLSKGYRKGFQTLQDKEKEKDKEKEMEIGGAGGFSKPALREALKSVYADYPRKEGKTKGLAKLETQIKTPEDLERLRAAVKNYRAKLESSGTETEFIKHFSTWVGEWRDWIDPETGTIRAVKKTGLELWREAQAESGEGA